MRSRLAVSNICFRYIWQKIGSKAPKTVILAFLQYWLFSNIYYALFNSVFS